MTREEKRELLKAIQAAEEAGDMDLAEKLSRQFPLAPALGRGLAESIGYQRAVDLGVNFEEVDAAYGPDWHINL